MEKFNKLTKNQVFSFKHLNLFKNRLNNISKEADEAVGIEVILPAEQGKEKRKKKK